MKRILPPVCLLFLCTSNKKILQKSHPFLSCNANYKVFYFGDIIRTGQQEFEYAKALVKGDCLMGFVVRKKEKIYYP
tara:strand:+ start:151 stop:381 length:231 start_codon:yes stop_codon:yes gene_type:complete